MGLGLGLELTTQTPALTPTQALTEWRAHACGRGCCQHHTTPPLPPRRPAALDAAGAPPGEGEGVGMGVRVGVGLGLRSGLGSG